MSFNFNKLNPNEQPEIFDTNRVDNIEIDGIDTSDYPDFCDAFISYAEYDGVEMTEEQLEDLNENYDFVYDSIINHLF